MKLGKWIKKIDVESLVLVTLWIEGDDEALWEGYLTEIPHMYLDYPIDFNKDPEDKTQKPIWIGEKENAYGIKLPYILINLKEIY